MTGSRFIRFSTSMALLLGPSRGANTDDRARRRAHDPLGRAAHDQAIQPAEALGPHHDQIHMMLPGVADDLPEGRPRHHRGLGARQEAERAVHLAMQCVLRLANHLLPQLFQGRVRDVRAGDVQRVVDDMQDRQVRAEPLGQIPRILHGPLGGLGEIHRAEDVMDGGRGQFRRTRPGRGGHAGLLPNRQCPASEQEHRHRGGPHDRLGHAAQHEAPDPAAPVGGHGDEVGPLRLRVVQDLLDGVPVPDGATHRQALGRQLPLEPGQVGLRFLHRADLRLYLVHAGNGVDQCHPQQQDLRPVERGQVHHLGQDRLCQRRAIQGNQDPGEHGCPPARGPTGSRPAWTGA
ncbi:MAG: hypothetical protein A3H39_14500 [candidate division NC10 bacterium RIFCSPLOWO2_02_FULL_66_22]|nr:MAG: hypothetical protein A3H39_14500 [candidate division NC10 bacterium RIFCSPLOWO2_02_FULL_66_22]